MEKKEINSIKLQLENQAKLISNQEGNVLSESLAKISSFMLHRSIKELDLEQMDADSLEDMSGFFEEIADCIQLFLEKTGGRNKDSTSDLAKLMLKVNKAEEEYKEWGEQISSLKRRNADLAANNEAAEEDYNKAKEENDRLNKEALRYTEDIIRGLKEENTSLALENAKKDGQVQEIARRRKSLTEGNKALQAKIDVWPEEEKKLLSERQNLEKIITDLKNVYETCSPEKQKELQKQIDDLKEQTEKEQKACEKLQSVIEENGNLLNKIVDFYSEQKKHAEEQDEKAASQLALLVKSYKINGEKKREALENIKKDADAMETNLARCRELSKQYESWLNGVETPLVSMAKVLNLMPEDTEKLREAMRKSDGELMKVKEIKSKAESVRVTIQQMQDLLDSCAKASAEDYKASRKASGGNY